MLTDPKHPCPKCGTKMEWGVMTEAQLDWFECPSCGYREYPQASDVD